MMDINDFEDNSINIMNKDIKNNNIMALKGASSSSDNVSPVQLNVKM